MLKRVVDPVQPKPRPKGRAYVRREPLQMMDCHQASQRMATPVSIERVARDLLPIDEKIADAVETVPRLRPRVLHEPSDTMVLARHPSPFPNRRRAQARARARFYVPKDGHQDGPMFLFIDRQEGVTLARCRGTVTHVNREAEKFVKSQGGTMADIQLMIDPNG